jgi:hypothetical protein
MHSGVTEELGRSRYVHLKESGRDKPLKQVPGLWLVHIGVHRNEIPVMRKVAPIGEGNGSSGRRREVLLSS